MNKPVKFYDDSVDTDGFLTKWEWNFGEGWEDFTPSHGFATHAFTETGTYYIDLRVTDSALATDTLDALIQIDVGVPSFDPPDPYDCSSSVSPHTMHLDLSMGTMNHASTLDICATSDGNWLFFNNGVFKVLDSWGTVVDNSFHTVIGTGPYLLSADFDSVNNNYAYIYGNPGYPANIQVISVTGAPVATVHLDTAPRAVCFDWEGNLWVLDWNWEARFFDESSDFDEDPCIGFGVPELDGRVYDMAFDFYNHALYIFSQGSDDLGHLVKINYDGTVGAVYAPIFDAYSVGPSAVGDIIIDNSSGDGASDCRIEVFSGEYTGAVARFDSELNPGGISLNEFWGAKAAAFLPGLTGLNMVIVLESCCTRYFDRYAVPVDW